MSRNKDNATMTEKLKHTTLQTLKNYEDGQNVLLLASLSE